MPNFNDEIKSEDDFTPFYRFFPSDEEFFANLIKEKWELQGPAEIDMHPLIYYDSGKTATRENTLGGSIYVYASTVTYPQIMSVSYESVKQTGSVSFDIRNPQWKVRNRMWTREVLRILQHYRRAGRTKLNGWDYLEISMVNRRDQDYVGFYHTVIDVKLYRVMNDITDNGRGD